MKLQKSVRKCRVAYLFLDGNFFKTFFCFCGRDSLAVQHMQHKAGNTFGFMQKELSDAQSNYT